jgi:hypothetical protein
MSSIILTAAALVVFLGLISHYTQKGLGEMSAPLRQFGMFLLEKAPGPAADMFQNKEGSGAKTWMQYGVFWLVCAGTGGFLASWHAYDPTALDSLSNWGWSWDDGSAMHYFNQVAMTTAVFSILLGGSMVAHSRATGSALASESNASLMAMVWTLQTMAVLLLPAIGSWLDFDFGNLQIALFGLISAGLVLSLLVNVFITSGNRGNAPIGVSSWFLMMALSTLFFSRVISLFGEVFGVTGMVWIADIISNGWVPLALMFAVGYHVIPHVSGRPIWSGSLTKASMMLLFVSVPPFFLAEATHASGLVQAVGAIAVTIGLFPVIGASVNMVGTMRGDASSVISSPGAIAAAAGAMLLPIFALLAFFTGLNVMVGDGTMATMADTTNMAYLYVIGGLFCLAALFHSYPIAAGRSLEGNASSATWLVIVGGVVATITALMSDWSISALTDGGVEDPASAVSGFGLTAAFAFYGVTIGFLLAGSSMVKTLLFGKPQAAGMSVSSDVSVYNLVEGNTSVRALFGRGVGLDTTLVIGSSEDESKGGMTIIEVSADLHEDKVDEFPAEFDENLVILTRWLCGRGTTTAQFFSWADVDNSGEIDMFEFSNALSVADIADLPPWDISKLVEVMDINGDGRLNLPELDIALMNIRNTLGIEFIAFESPEEVEAPAEMVEQTEEEAAPEQAAESEDETEEETTAEVDYSKMKKSELVELAKSMGIPSSGNKSVLIERISKA